MTRRPARAHVVVAGLGAMGAAASYHLARRGAQVTGIEARGPAHSQGSSHGQSRIIRQAYFEDPCYVPLVLRAYELWAELQQATRELLLQRTGALMVGPERGQVVSGSLESARRWRLAHRLLYPEQIRRLFPQLNPDPGDAALFEPEAGMLAPEAGVLAHLGQAAAAGAQLHFGEEVRAWKPGGGGLVVSTASADYPADRLVLAPGPWAPRLLPQLPLEVERQVQVWLEPTDVSAFEARRLPVFLFDREPRATFYGLPSQDRRTVKVALHHGGETTSAEDVRRQVTEADVTSLRRELEMVVPELGRAPVHRAEVCLYTNTPDRDFVVGLLPEDRRVAVAAGFSGHGYKFSPVVGEILADLALHGSTDHPIERFRPDRWSRPGQAAPPAAGPGGTRPG